MKQIATLTLPQSVMFNDAVACSEKLRNSMIEACQVGFVDQVVTIDAGSVTAFDSSILAVLLQCRRDAAQKKRTIAVVNMPARLRELTKLYGIEALLPDGR